MPKEREIPGLEAQSIQFWASLDSLYMVTVFKISSPSTCSKGNVAWDNFRTCLLDAAPLERENKLVSNPALLFRVSDVSHCLCVSLSQRPLHEIDKTGEAGTSFADYFSK